jgi:hypothetical protein
MENPGACGSTWPGLMRPEGVDGGRLPGALSAYTSRLTQSTNSGDLQSVTITRNVDGQIRPVRSATRYERRWFSETIARPCKLPIPALVYGVGSCGGGPAVSGDLQRTVPAGHPTECPSLCQEMGSVGDGRSGAVLISSHVGHRFPAGHFSHSLNAAGPNRARAIISPDVADPPIRDSRIDHGVGDRAMPHEDLESPGINTAARQRVAGRVAKPCEHGSGRASQQPRQAVL